MAVTLKDVAERAGVSTSAVSRTFTEGASVSPKTRAKVERAADTLGYSPNALASSLTTGRTKLIGLVSNNFTNPLFLEVFDRFTRGLQDRGLRPLLVNLSDEVDPIHSVRKMREYSVDGAIVASSTLPPSFAEAYRAAGIPVVHSFGRYTTAPQVHVVGIDNVACGRMAGEALIARGYKRVAFMGGPEKATSTQDRALGFLGALHEHPAIEVSVSYASAYSFDAGRDEMTKLLASDPAEAYFCGDDVLSVGALSAVREAELRCPEDIGIIGLNDMQMAAWQLINLTTIRQPVAEIISASIDLVISTVEDPTRHPETRLFPCRVVERGTLRALP